MRQEMMSYDEERSNQLWEVYRLLLFDKWRDCGEEERRQWITRMMYAKYGAFNEREVFEAHSRLEDTDIYKYMEDEGLLE